MPQVNDCPECQAFDDKTREMMAQLFSKEEAASLTVIIAANVNARLKNMNSLRSKMTMIQRVQERRSLDMMGRTMGKFLVTFDDAYRAVMLKTIREMGIEVNPQHERCPHEHVTAPATGDEP